MVNFRENPDDFRRRIVNALNRHNNVNVQTSAGITSSSNIMNNGNILDVYQEYQAECDATLKLAEKNGYQRNLKIENSQVNNTVLNYKGDAYSIEFNDFVVTIKNKTKNTTTILNLANLLLGMSRNDRVDFMKTIQKLPGEVLEDLAKEVDKIESSTGRDMHTVSSNSSFVAGGYYAGRNDTITTKPKYIVHELGHAMDYHGAKNLDGKNNYSRVEKNPKFLKAFEKGIERFKKAGFKQYDYNDKRTWSNSISDLSGNSNYCTANPRELWAELYKSLTTGSCKSMNTIIKYFPEAIEAGKEILQEIRTENEISRHNTTRRTFMRAIDNIRKDTDTEFGL